MLNLIDTPFSYYGSYMAIAFYDYHLSYHGIITNPKGDGLYLKSVKGKSRDCTGVFKLIPYCNGKEADYSIVYDYHEIKLIGKQFIIKICFVNDSNVILHVKGKNISLVLDTLPQSKYDYSLKLNDGTEDYYVINSYKSQTKYFVSCSKDMNLKQQYADDMQGSSESKFEINGDEFDIIVQDIPTHINKREKIAFTYEKYAQHDKNYFEEYSLRFPKPLSQYSQTYVDAIYTTWSATVKPEGLLKRYSTYISNTFFPGIWSWDHCFNSIGLMGSDNELAYNNMMIVYDFQDQYGQLPGSMNDSNIHWNFAKPPIQGLFISKMMQDIDFDENQYEDIYDKLYKQINYWLEYHDCNNDGIPEYHHGNDSGYDNSTVFINNFVVDSPDLTAYLIRGLETLEKIALLLHKDYLKIQSQKKKLIELFKEHFIVDDCIIARETVTQKIIKSDSILPYASLVIAKYLPENIVSKMINELKTEFMTEYGFATEKTTSPFYESDGYWRGPIWASEMIVLIDSLDEIGENELVKEIIIKFLNIIKREGFAENFDAQTGTGLRDPAYTWTSSGFIYLHNKLKKIIEKSSL
ncbi:MAG: hypothetical protein KHY19_02425 [Coprobacillus cateniformis]|nr:hypothetical protein [Coprobacillus cateniformis]